MEKMKCWEVFKCNENECPAYKSRNLRCWLFSGTRCRDEIQGKFLEKMEMCLVCEVFKANMDTNAMRETIKGVNKQFKEFRQIVENRDRELESTGLELAIGLSEVFEALKNISSGDPAVRISETSEDELITKLKHMINLTAEDIGEFVNQSHEFAMGLAEHFDVLHKVTNGDLNARVSGSSQVELLESLKKVTNQMIGSISREITERKEAEEALREKEEWEALILRSLPMAFYTAQPLDGFGWTWVSEQIDQLSGFPPSKYVEEEHFWASRLHPDDRKRVLKEFETINKKGTIATEYRWQCADGLYRWFHDQAVLIRDAQGKPKEIIGTWRDITERKEAAEELKQANENLLSRVNELKQLNREISLFGEMGGMLQTCITSEEAYNIIAQFAQQLFPAEAGALYVFSSSRNILETVAIWGESLFSEHVFIPGDCWALRRGQVHMVEDPRSGLFCKHISHSTAISYMCVPMMAHGETLGMLHLQNNVQGLNLTEEVRARITESKKRLVVNLSEQVALALANLKLQETLRIQSIRDPLTGLFNRRYMEESLEREVHRATRKQSQLGVIMLDLDNFKQFNDTYGHATGDAMLRELGQFLNESIRDEDIACRYGGEEFALILPEVTLDVIRKRAEQIRMGVKHLNVNYLGRPIGTITISAGIAIFPDNGPSSDAILRAADAALYRAKAEGRDKIVVEQAVT